MMTLHGNESQWKIALPLAAVAAAALMVGLAALTHHNMSERNEFALDGRLLGLAHSVETRLRDSGVADADRILTELLAETGPEVAGLALLDATGATLATAGLTEHAQGERSVDLFLGRHAGTDARPRRQSAGQPGPRGGGRGRYELRMQLDPTAGALPIAGRLLLPTVFLAAIALVWFAILAGRFLDRQRDEIRRASERRRLEGLARAGAGLAHQLRTPLATIKGTTQLMSEDRDNDGLGPRIETVLSEADRMNRLLGRLLDYARPPTPEPQLVRVFEKVAEAAGRHPGIENRVAEELIAWVDGEHLEEILDNVLNNAVFFSPTNIPVVVDATVEDGRLRLNIRDGGPGPGDDPEAHFEPYQTSRADGTGLGLPIARALAEANHGSLVLVKRDEGGCEAVLVLPASARRR